MWVFRYGFVNILCVLVIATSCSSDGTDIAAPPADQVVEGWVAFEAGDYAGAITQFSGAIALDNTNAEAHNGLGWTFLRTSQLPNARQEFDVALTNGHPGADPHAGAAIALRDTEPSDYAAVIVAANAALAIDPEYVFAHDTSFDWHDVWMLLAQSHFTLGAYDFANAAVVAVGGNGQDTQSPTYVADLLTEIERLTSVYTN